MATVEHHGSLRAMPDDQLGSVAVSLSVAELRWLPDVVPAVIDRVSRDAVAYPEQFDRRSRPAPPPPVPRPPSERSAGRTLGRLVVLAVFLVVVAAIVMVMATASGVVAAAAAETAPTADPAAEGAAATTDPAGEETAATADPAAVPAVAPAFGAAGSAMRIDLFADGLDAPVYLTDDGLKGQECLYVVERGGTIRIVDPDGQVRLKPFLDISELVATGPEQGLHAIAFHPQFRKNGRFFVHYNARPDGQSIIAEFKGRPCKPANQKPAKPSILTIDQEFPNNNGGWIGFGPDGMLYIMLGDGGGSAADPDPKRLGQDPGTRLAKALRIDVNVRPDRLYVVPRDNPYADGPKRFAPETWAQGLRDPRRASFDRETGDLWIGEVGQALEEVNRIPAGEGGLNFGWSDVEGEATCQPRVPECDPAAYEPPVYSYDKVRAITGGYVYRGGAIPELEGVYLFGDFASGAIWGLDAEAVAAGEPAVAEQLLEAPLGLVSFGEDDGGELYVISLDGSIFRINPEGS